MTMINPLNTIAISGASGSGANGILGAYGSALGSADDMVHLGSRGVSIRILPANGGTILSVRDENEPGRVGDLYVIGQEQDVGTEIGKILTMHYLKK